jgi:hypothetical protein
MRRSDDILLVGYLLARRSGSDGGPPAVLGCCNWNETYDRFSHLADGREQVSFRNSLRNTRDQADALFPNVRRGWHHPDGTPAVGRGLSDLHRRLMGHSSAELDQLLRHMSTAHVPAKRPVQRA